MTLHLYFARRFLGSVAAVLGLFLILLVMLDLVEQVRRFDGLSFARLLGLTLLNVPQTLYGILPLIVILATLWLFLTLARTSELVVTRASGRSALRSLTAPLGVAFVLGLIAVAVFNPIVAATSTQYDAVSNRYASGGGNALSLSREGLWLRQGDEAGQTVIRADRASPDGTEVYGATFVRFAADGGAVARIEADSARLSPGAWALRGVKSWSLGDANPERTALVLPQMTVPTSLTQSQIMDGFGTPAAVPIWELAQFIDRLERAGFSARKHRVWLQMELAQPLLLVAMVLVGAGFTMRQTRAGRAGLMVLAALALGFSLYFVRNFAQILGDNGQIPVALAAWGPPVAAVLLPLGLLLHWEDG